MADSYHNTTGELSAKEKRRAYAREYKRRTEVRERERIASNARQREYSKRPEVKARKKAYEKKRSQRPGVKVKNLAKARRYQIKKKYGLDEARFSDLEKARNSVCAICFRPETGRCGSARKTARLAIDHDHASGKVRGLLCMSCNNGLGRFRDNVELLLSTVAYLKGG